MLNQWNPAGLEISDSLGLNTTDFDLLGSYLKIESDLRSYEDVFHAFAFNDPGAVKNITMAYRGDYNGWLGFIDYTGMTTYQLTMLPAVQLINAHDLSKYKI